MSFFRTYRTLIGVISIPLLMLLLLRAFGFDGLMGQDSYEYLRYTEQIKQFYLTGIHPGSFFWPKGYPLVAGLFSLIIPTNIAIQLTTALSFSGTIWFTHRLIKLVHPTNKNSTLFLVIALLFSPYFLRAGLSSMSDMLSVFCLTGSFFYGISYQKNNNFKLLALCVLLGVYAVFTRYAAIVPVLVLFIIVSISWFKNIKLAHLFVLIVPFILIPVHFYFESKSIDFIKHEWLLNWNISNFFNSDFITVDGAQKNTFLNLLYAFSVIYHPGFLFLNGILFFVFAKELRSLLNSTTTTIGLGIVFYALFLAGIPFQNNRFLLLTYPLVLVLFALPFHHLLQRFIQYKRLIIGVLILTQIALFTRAFYTSYQLNLIEKHIALQLQPFQNETLYSFDIDIAMQGRGVHFNYKNMWLEKYDSFEKGALVLFNKEKLADQWTGKNPMINWDSLNANYQLTIIKELDAGWKLYRIE